jgi:hypothetical protein
MLRTQPKGAVHQPFWNTGQAIDFCTFSPTFDWEPAGVVAWWYKSFVASTQERLQKFAPFFNWLV